MLADDAMRFLACRSDFNLFGLQWDVVFTRTCSPSRQQYISESFAQMVWPL